MVGSILNPNQRCFAISAAMGSIRNPKQYCFAIIAAMGSIQNPKQYCFAISSITTHKVLTSWMHEAPHWKCQCRILTARTSGHGKKMCRPWSQLAGNMPGHLALIRGNESHIGDYNLIFFVLFCVVWIVVTVSVTRQSPIYIYIYIYVFVIGCNQVQGGLCHYNIYVYMSCA